MFEDYTYDYLLEDALNNAPEDIDTREGSVFYDAVSGTVLKIAKFYADLDIIASMVTVDKASGEALDAKAYEFNLTRHEAIATAYNFSYSGAEIEEGERFFADNLYFRTVDIDGTLYLQAEEGGEAYNNITEGTAAVPVNSIEGLESATFGFVYIYGEDEEDDEALRSRVKDAISLSSQNGTALNYKVWCESIDGVGRARIYPLWNGENTVLAVLVNSLGAACSHDVVAAVQEYVDPATQGLTATVDGVVYTVGDGTGAGVANIGAHFTAVAANEVIITITAEVEFNSSDTDDIKTTISETIDEYISNLFIEAEQGSDIVVRLARISMLILNTDGVNDLTSVLINGESSNLTLSDMETPVFSEVVFV